MPSAQNRISRSLASCNESRPESRKQEDVEDLGREDLFKSKRGEFNEPRSQAIFLFRKLRRDSPREISAPFRMEKYSSVSSIIQRLKQKIQKDRKLEIRINVLTGRLNKG